MTKLCPFFTLSQVICTKLENSFCCLLDDEKTKEEREEEEKLKAKLLEVFQEEKRKEKLKKQNQKLNTAESKKKLAEALVDKIKGDKSRADKEKQKLVAKLQSAQQDDDRQQATKLQGI